MEDIGPYLVAAFIGGVVGYSLLQAVEAIWWLQVAAGVCGAVLAVAATLRAESR